MAKGAITAAKKETTHSLNHPPYSEMICEAISQLKDRSGSSQPAISNFIQHKYEAELPQNFKKLVSLQLKRLVKSDKLLKIKNSYKISSAEKLELASKESEKPKEKKPKKIEKMKRLSQVKTPDALKKVNKDAKMKKLSEVKTPDWLNQKKQNKVRPLNK
ncbi:histone H1-like [Euphorbia lathyris]|uniref:histone H1-like n=1 Tax=Euphorbia lathyris TaxID=212925 RepID=UPI00331320A2